MSAIPLDRGTDESQAMAPLESLRVATWNVNGLPSAVRNGLCERVAAHDVDVLLVQETKCNAIRCRELLAPLMHDYELFCRSGEQPGRSGVAILARIPAVEVRVELGDDQLDSEGRLVGVRAAGLEFWSCYVPSGARSKRRQALKLDFLRLLVAKAEERAEVAPVLLCGDFNVAHKRLDIEGGDPKRAIHGLLPEERDLLDALESAGWVDIMRANRGNEPIYTWQSRTKGWRLDYIWASPNCQLTCEDLDVDPLDPASDHSLVVASMASHVRAGC